jgi:hypothetical protein
MTDQYPDLNTLVGPFPMDQAPARPGTYMRCFHAGTYTCKGWAYFTGSHWGVTTPVQAHANAIIAGARPSKFLQGVWYGLPEPTKESSSEELP